MWARHDTNQPSRPVQTGGISDARQVTCTLTVHMCMGIHVHTANYYSFFKTFLRQCLLREASPALSLSHTTLYHLGPGIYSPHRLVMVPESLPLALPQPHEQSEVRDSVQPYVTSSYTGLGTGWTHNMFLVAAG